MEKRLFIAEASDLISIVEDSFDSSHLNLPLMVNEVTNYWVNDILRATGTLPVTTMRRQLDEVETFYTLSIEEMKDFKEVLLHTIENFDVGDLGVPTMHHRVENGSLEFYILRG